MKKKAIESKKIFAENFDEILNIAKRRRFSDVLTFLEELVKAEDPNASSGSINNCRGRWFELLFTFLVNSSSAASVSSGNWVFVKLGTASEHKIFEIFEEVNNGSVKIIIPDGYSFNMSIPDLVCLKLAPDSQHTLVNWKSDILKLKNSKNYAELVEHLLIGWRILVDEPIGAEFIKAFCSLKTSLRPDRKYQPMYEAEAIRAILKRICETKDNRAKYYMVGPIDAGKTEKILTENLSLFSIADQGVTAHPTIDKVFKVNSMQEIEIFLAACLRLN